MAKNTIISGIKTGKYIRQTYPMNTGTITTTDLYKYLRFLLIPSGELCIGLKDLLDKALRAYHKLKNRIGHFSRLHPAINLSLLTR